MRTYRIKVSYDGAAFAGWQTQSNAVTVQQSLEEALARVLGQKVHVEGSGRTDAGVHAVGQVASFQQHRDAPLLHPRQIIRAVNSLLPGSVRIHQVRLVDNTFHARFDARGKEYHYHIYSGPDMPAPLHRRAWHVWQPLDVRLMRRAARHLAGRHDFSAFTVNPGYERGSKVRTLHPIRISEGPAALGPTRFGADGRLIILRVRGDGFLFRMVRCIAGTLVAAGRGTIGPDDVASILRSKDRRQAKITAPADGLYLFKVFY